MNKEAIKSKLEFVFRAVELTSAQKAIINDVVMSIVDTAISGVTEPGITKASNTVLGGIKTGYSQNAKNYPVSVDGDGKAFVNVP